MCLVVGTAAALARYNAGDYEATVQHCRNTIDIEPDHLAAHRLLGAAYVQLGCMDDALASLQTALRLLPTDGVTLSWLAHATAVMGDGREACTLVERAREPRPGRYVSQYHLAIALAGLRRPDEAFDALDAAWRDRDPSLALMAVEPRLSPLRADSRFADLAGWIALPLAVPTA